MRILTFIHSFDPGGVERVALRLVRDWRARGVDAPLFVGRDMGVMREDIGRDLAFECPRQPRFGSAWWETFWMIFTLPGAIRRLQPDVLFCPGNTYTVVAFFMRVMLGKRCPPIVAKISNELEWKHKSAMARFWYRMWLWLQGRAFARAVAMEEAMVAEIERYLRLTSQQVAVVPDPAMTDDLVARLAAAPRPAWRPGEPRRFVAVGRLVRQKNLPLMLAAFARGAGPADSLDLIGEGPDRDALEAQAGALGIADRVAFVGYRPEPALELQRYHALLLSSDFEGVPAVLLEALAAGIAIVATRCSASIASLLGHGRLGTLVAPGDRDALARAIEAIDPREQDRSASLAAARRFTTQAAGPAYLRLAADVTGRTPNWSEAPRDIAIAAGARLELPLGPVAVMAEGVPLARPLAGPVHASVI